MSIDRIGAAAVPVAAVAAAVALGTSRAEGASDAAAIAFAKDDGVYVRAAGRVQRVAARASSPAWSPDRKRIAFVRLGDIYVMRADGSG